MSAERRALRDSNPAADAFVTENAGGVTITDVKRWGYAHGMRAHRGVLHPDEWLDHDAVELELVGRLGCTLDEARQVYGRKGGGPLPGALRALRDRLDVVMAEAAGRGGNLALMARQLGVPERNLQRAAERGALTDGSRP